MFYNINYWSLILGHFFANATGTTNTGRSVGQPDSVKSLLSVTAACRNIKKCVCRIFENTENKEYNYWTVVVVVKWSVCLPSTPTNPADACSLFL